MSRIPPAIASGALVLALMALPAVMARAAPQGIEDDLCLGSSESPRGTRFQATTAGSPVSAFMGRWSTDERRASLCFRGGHVVGTGTTIVAGWRSPFTRGKPFPRLEGTFSFPGVNPFAEISFVFSERYRAAGNSWSRWYRLPFTMDQLSFGVEGDFLSCLLSPSRLRVRFEWRLAMDIAAPAEVEGDVALRLREGTDCGSLIAG